MLIQNTQNSDYDRPFPNSEYQLSDKTATQHTRIPAPFPDHMKLYPPASGAKRERVRPVPAQKECPILPAFKLFLVPIKTLRSLPSLFSYKQQPTASTCSSQSLIPMAAAATIEDLHSDLIARVLRHMDGPTLVSTGCSTSALRSLASDPALWRHLCLSTWPSLTHPRLLSLLSDSPGAHRHLFSHSFPFPSAKGDDYVAPEDRKNHILPDDLPTELISAVDLYYVSSEDRKNHILPDDLPTELISAVDLYHKGVPVFSRVVETKTSSSWFLTSPFRIDVLERKDPEVPHSAACTDEPAINPQDLTLSWIVIDPKTRRAVNLSSRRPVSVDRHWYSGEIMVKFAVVLRGCAVSVMVACGEMGHVMEASLTVEDMDGISLAGRGSLEILKGTMEGERRGVKWEKEVKGKYEEYLKRKKERRERKARREGIMDLICTVFGGLMFLSFLILLACR